MFPQDYGQDTLFWQKHHRSDVMFYLMCPVRRHVMSLYPIPGDVNFEHGSYIFIQNRIRKIPYLFQNF